MSGIVTASLLPDRKPVRRMISSICQNCGAHFQCRENKSRPTSSCSLACRDALTKLKGYRRPEGVGYHHWTDAENEAVRDCYDRGGNTDATAAAIGVSGTALRLHARVALGIRHRRVTRSLTERFFDYVSPEPNSGCWLWDGSCDRKGYAQLRVSKTVLRAASHIALEIDGRSVPQGLNACHHCDNPACVNPTHLFIGTQKDNTDDMMRKGRGSKPPLAKRGQGLKEFCIRGHRMAGDNLYHTPTGRGCRECRRIWKASRRAALRASQ